MIQAIKDFFAPAALVSSAMDVRILRDGVFPTEDRRANKGEIVCCNADVARTMIGRGDAERV
jgi:hypothetical protein